MDLSNIKPGERELEIVHPGSGQPLGIRVMLVSLDDDRLKRIKRDITDQSLKLQAKGKSFKADELERNSKALLFGATTGWKWYNPTGKEGESGYNADAQPTLDDEVPEYNQRNFYRMVDEFSWFSDQIREALEESRTFFDNSKSS